ncbi:MAG: TIGR01244 family sulfur transferase [Rhodobacter sp.]|nr:TIGR01244 family sulfur transferase [Rhodobacter sp.]
MDIRQITPEYAVSPQIAPTDMAALKAAGFVAVIDNRPDTEVPPDLQSAAMRTAAEAAGLAFVENPVINGGLTMEMVTGQGAAVAAADGPVLAYCRSGTRSAFVWALSQAGKRSSAEIAADVRQAGYDLPGLEDQIASLTAG